MRAGSLLLREAEAADIEKLLAFRNDPAVNRFMLRTRVEPEVFRKEWQAVPISETDFSCVAELDGSVVSMGFLEVADGMGQSGMPRRTEASSATSSTLRRTRHSHRAGSRLAGRRL